MTFLHPWALGFGAIAPVIVALYLLKVRRRPVAVSTLMFWQRVVQENQRRALLQKLRQWLSLLLHLLIFALILLALARPTFDRAVHAGSSTVLILDTRARMQAVEAGGEIRLQSALKSAGSFIRQAGPMRQFAVLAPGVRLGFSPDEKLLRECIQSTVATDGGGDLDESIHLAVDLLSSRAGEKQIIVFTDRADSNPSSSVGTEVVATGSSRNNVSILRFAARPVPASPETFEVLGEVANFGATPWQGSLEITLDGRSLDMHPLQLAAGERQTVVFPIVVTATAKSTEDARLVAKIDGHDALPIDDIAYALIRRVRPPRVLLVTRNNWFLEKVLAADVRLRFELLDPESYEPSMASQFDAVILDDLRSSPGELPRTGNFLYLRQSPFSSGEQELKEPLITDVSPDHSALRGVNLEHVTLGRAIGMQLPTGVADWTFEAPLLFGTTPLFITAQRPNQRLAAFAFGIADSDLPLRIAFPLLISGTIQWLTGAPPFDPPSARAGESIELPGGIFTASKNGFQPSAHSPDGSPWVAVNTFDERESDLRVAPDGGPAISPNHLPLAALDLRGWPMWPLLALAGALLLGGEWWLFHQRRTE